MLVLLARQTYNANIKNSAYPCLFAMLSLRQIRYFQAVADTGSFTLAAAQVYIAQPALSRQIALLEAELGVALFVREARGVRLTPAGQLFRARTENVGTALEAAVEDARRLDRGEAGVLRLLHSSSVPLAGPLLEALRCLTDAAPAARVELDRVSSEVQVAEIAAGRADVGVARMPVLRREAAVAFTALPEERLVLAVPGAHPLAGRTAVSLAELAGETFVTAVHRERGGLARRVTDLCLARGFVPRSGAVVSRKTSMLNLVAAGYGVAVVPAGMAGLLPAGARLVALTDAEATSASAVLLPLVPSPLARRFAELCGAAWAGVAGAGC